MYEREWIDCRIELPPKDGKYEIKTGYIDSRDDPLAYIGPAEYDGWGFKVISRYMTPSHWREYREPIKKYGKLNECDH